MFGNSLFRPGFDDPFFSAHQQHMQMGQMMGAFQPLGVMGVDDGRQRQMAHQGQNMMSPFGFMGGGMFPDLSMMMGNMHHQMGSVQSNPNAQFYSHSSMMSYSNTGEGAPKVYQATTSTHQAPGGVRETRRSVRDSETATERLAVGRYINDRGHVIDRTRHTRSGDTEENQEYINLDEEELPSFHGEWRQRTRPYGGHGQDRRSRLDRGHRSRAITDGTTRYNPHDRDRSNPRQDRPTPAITYRERD